MKALDYKLATSVIKSNYPPKNYTMLREALNTAIKAMEENEMLKAEVAGLKRDVLKWAHRGN